MASQAKRARTKTPRKFVEKPDNAQENRGFFDYFRFGESYTSLVLGIVVVIITAILLVSFVRNRNIGQVSQPDKEISAISTVQTSITPEATGSALVTQPVTASPTVRPTVTLVPTKISTATVTPRAVVPTARPTAKPTAVAAVRPTATVTTRPTATVTLRPTATKVPAKPTAVPTQIAQKGKMYTVATGDSLWTIAERTYKSGYNWVDIAKANKLTNPGVLLAGQKLTLPDVQTRTVKSTTELKPQASVTGAAITANTYTVVKGDYLWDIAIRAYGTGFKFADIAKANKITNPNVILPGTRLTIPR